MSARWSVTLWLAITSIVLLITVKFVSSYDGSATALTDTKRLKYVALTMTLLFLATVAIHIYQIIIS